VPEQGTRADPALHLNIALTGATGFVGRNILAQAQARAVSITALARPQRGRDLQNGDHLHWVTGGLDQPDALASLVAGADVVIHCAGATKALNAGDFHRVNTVATRDLVQAAQKAGVRHFILLSSLAATRPSVSGYAASKAASESVALSEANAMPLTTLRAPAVIGPGDQATAPLFKLIARGWMPVLGKKARKGRFSVIDVQDLATLLLDLACTPAPQSPNRVFAPYGHHNIGWSEMKASAARITGRPIREVILPEALATLAGHGADLAARLTRQAQVFSSGKLKEMRAGDWNGDTALETPTPLDETMRRCLTPFLRVGNASDKDTSASDGNPE
jgi:nucleoside-diphosphate-sugar epimerase